MFDFLDNIEATKVISAVYYAIRLIGHRDQFDNISDGFRVESLGSEPSAEDQQLALSLLSEIEVAEGANLQSLEDSSAEEYIISLSQIAQHRAFIEFGYDAERGQELLAQFEPPIGQQVGQNSA